MAAESSARVDGPATSDTNELLTLDDILTMQQISQVALAPDGATVAYVLAEASQAEEHPRGQIYLLAIDAPEAQPRPFTAGAAMDGAPRWSPDGGALAFLSDREKRGTSQLYVIALDGGEARRLTDERGGVANPQWHPGGSMLSYLAIAAPSEEAEQRTKDRDDRVVASEVKGRHRLWLVGADGDGARPLTPEDRHVVAHAWSPDSARVAALTAATPEWNEQFGAMRLGIYPLEADQEARDLGPAPLTADLVWSRDGGTLFAHSGSVAEFPRSFLAAWSLVGEDVAAPRLTLSDLPASPFWLGRARDADDLLLLAARETHMPLYRVSARGDRAELLGDVAPDRGSLPTLDAQPPALSLSADGRRVVMLRGDGAHAYDLWLWEEGSGMRRLTDVNPWLRQKRLGKQEEIRWRSFDDMEVGGLLITPPDYVPGRRYPLVVNVHGGPTWLWTDHLHANWHDWGQWLAAAGFVVLLPNPRGSAGRGNDFAAANVRDIGGGDYRDVMAGVDHVVARGLVDERRMGIGGWSYGGTLTPWTITQTERFRCAVMGAGICNWVSFTGTCDIRIFGDRLFDAETHHDAAALWERSALRHVADVRTPTLIVHGEQDVRVPVSQGREFYSALRHMGVPTELVIYPREGHSFVERHHQRDLLTRIRDWFVRYLL
jgi:dipeptidyl aminopeptidase/acylaminoacyl peptidase